MLHPTILKPPYIHNFSFHCIGAIILFLNKIKHAIEGYRNPRTFPITEYQKVIQYDFRVVERWIYYLNEYSKTKRHLKGKNILELGPGPDLGTGLILLMKGAKKYNAIDVNDLAGSTPYQFYEKLFEHMRQIGTNYKVIDFLEEQLNAMKNKYNDKINYLVNKNFDLSLFKSEDVDLVFSQAAFEHFDNFETTVKQLNALVKPGAILIAEIDLKTHTRWIRDLDPLNIYRYSDFLYNLLRFSGSPNRMRPFEYEKILRENGWLNIRFIPLTILEKKYVLKVQNSLIGRFRDQVNQMDLLSVMICARKSEET